MSQTLWPLPGRQRHDRPELLLIGSPHLANQHRDLINHNVPDVLTDARQREIVQLVDSLASWEPTRLAVEWSASDQAGLDQRLDSCRGGRLAVTASECDQLALRLAVRAGLGRIHAVDCFDDRPGDAADYDFAGWADRRVGRTA